MGEINTGDCVISHRTMKLKIGKLSVQLAASIFLLLAATYAYADATLLIEEPINLLGHLTSTGHSALLIDDLCSDDHLHMRWCGPGEDGSVISRYSKIGNVDWIAMSPSAYFFASDRTPSLPDWTSTAEINRIRSDYRQKHLQQITAHSKGDAWVRLIGESYRRRIYCIRVHTTRDQEERLMQWLNSRKNRTHFNLFYANCADFTRQMINVLYPHAVGRNFFFDVEMTTPRQLASSLHHYAELHPEMLFQVTVMPQIPGETPRSLHLYGITESIAKTKYYLYPIAIVQPAAIGAILGSGYSDHRYSLYSEPAPASTRYLPIYGSQLEDKTAPAFNPAD